MSKPRILMVDDSDIIRETLASFLGTIGYPVDVAADGQSALDKFLVFKQPLVITDLQMPRMAGLTLLKQIKAEHEDTQVIILTGHASLDSAVEALRLGAYDYQLKPLEDLDSFARLVERALNHYALLTENKRLVEELQQINSRLESQVAERTRELQAANEALRSLDRLKNDFIAVVSHELRTPLTALVFETQMLTHNLHALSPEKVSRIYACLATDTRRLQIQIDNLLDFALIERGELVLNFQPCSINQIARDVVDLYEARASEKHLSLSLSLPPTTALAIIADGPRLRSALVHLVDNAVKFTPDGGTITISVHDLATLPGGSEAAMTIAVRDNGIGIPPDVQQNLFTAFSQADMSTTRRYGGMGIGLTLAGRIVAAHRGKITFKSELGNGSLFALWVPTRQPESDMAQKTWSSEQMSAMAA